uniref:Phospholipid/glycerol acyltransferase domain-containing protein n=1 Tax=Oryza glumipatula TaxID=40148 RepID=A0A0D9YRR2_9ORYZ
MPLLPSSASRASRSSLSVPLSAHGGPSPSGPVDAVGCPTPPRETMPSPSLWARRTLSSVHAASRPSGKKRNRRCGGADTHTTSFDHVLVIDTVEFDPFTAITGNVDIAKSYLKTFWLHSNKKFPASLTTSGGYNLQEHVQLPDNNPLLIFPEGTCVNNRYTVMFKKIRKMIWEKNIYMCGREVEDICMCHFEYHEETHADVHQTRFGISLQTTLEDPRH